MPAVYPPDLTPLLARLPYQFQQLAWLEQALTHRSYSGKNNERLEFLGDGVLDCVIALELFDAFPRLSEGELSRLRASLVNQGTLAQLAESLDLGMFLRLGEGELKSAGFRRPSILADALEAIFGAALLDGGFDAARGLIRRLYQPLMLALDPRKPQKDAKSRLQEHLQGRHLPLPDYRVDRIEGRDHQQCFHVACTIESLGVTTMGDGSSRRLAEQAAAEAALDALKVSL